MKKARDSTRLIKNLFRVLNDIELLNTASDKDIELFVGKMSDSQGKAFYNSIVRAVKVMERKQDLSAGERSRKLGR